MFEWLHRIYIYYFILDQYEKTVVKTEGLELEGIIKTVILAIFCFTKEDGTVF